MGGLFSAPQAPIQSNEGAMKLAEAQMEQNQLLMNQQLQADDAQRLADEAASENLREIEIRDAEAQAEKDEREQRMATGKKDLLYGSAMGIVDDDDDDDMLLLGGS